MNLDYSNYLKLNNLLTLQHPLSNGPVHDEQLFIVTHQATELWFKLLLHELDYLATQFSEGHHAEALDTISRVIIILKNQVTQFEILETLKPTSFSTIREALGSSSGFQSSQFRELEFFLGIKHIEKISNLDLHSDAQAKLYERFMQPTLWDYFLVFIARRGYLIPDEQLHRDVTKGIVPCEHMQNILRDIYFNQQDLTQICERLIDMDALLQQWRYRHLQIVKRMIGTKNGTGGTSGINYLAQRVLTPVFPDLWALRSLLQ